jgi:hypothetical protein
LSHCRMSGKRLFLRPACLRFAFTTPFLPHIIKMPVRGNTPVPSGVSLAPQIF